MLAKTAKYGLGVVAILVLGFGVAALAQAASPTPISACPYNITAPGSYVVTRNLTAAGTCITIVNPLDNVGLDLGGHSITGNGSGYGIDCITPGGLLCNNVIVANGTVARFSTGIFLNGNFNTVAEITVQQSTGTDNTISPRNGGIVLIGSAQPDTLNTLNLVANSSSIGNVGPGIVADIVSDSISNNNGGYGGNGIEATTVSDSQVNNNGGFGIGSTSSVTASTAQGNVLDGISGAAVMNSYASGNGNDGIAVGTGPGTNSAGSVTGSVAKNNGNRGIFLTCPGAAFGNTANKNSGGNLVTSDNTCVLLDNQAP